MRIACLKYLDGVLGSALARLLPGATPREPARLRRVLVIRPGGIGDALLLVPALAALKARYPEAELTVLAERRNAAAFRLAPAVDRVLCYDGRSGLCSALAGGYDVVIDTEQWHRLSAVLARLTGAPVSAGFATNERARLFTHPVHYSQDEYEAQSFLRLLEPLGIAMPQVAAPFLAVPEGAHARAERLLGELAEAPFVALFPGASIPERRWGASRFGELAGLLKEQGTAVLVVGGKVDAADGEAIVRGGRGLNLAGRTSLAETAAVLSRSALLFSGDSGVLHLAVGLGIPTVSLFGPGIEAKWGARGEAHTVLNRRLPCSPCTRFGTTPPCPIGARCLQEIGVPEVLAAVQRALRGADTSLLSREKLSPLRSEPPFK